MSAAMEHTTSPPRAPRASTLLSLMLLPLLVPVANAADQSASVERGRRLYMSIGCYQCHGTVGQGGTAGPRLAPGPMPLEALRVFLRNTARAMPAYPETILTDAGIADLHAYLASIPPAPRVGDLPALKDLRR